MRSNFKEDEVVKVQGKQYPIVGGRLRLAHEENAKLSIESNIIEIKDERAVIQVTVRTEKGNFTGIGNASTKRDRMLSNALIELAETRAIARALRFAGYGVEFTGFEEMPELPKEKAASKSQIEALVSMAKQNGMGVRGLHSLMKEITGKEKSADLTSDDVSKMMTSIKIDNKKDISNIS